MINKGLLSPEIFQISELISLITEPMNHFLLGVPGSGKTMVLAFLRVECIAFINQNENIKREFQQIWPHISSKLWGVYHGLLINEEFLSPQNFKGFGLDDSIWTSVFCDFLNALYLKRMLKHISLATTSPDHYIPKWLGFSGKQDEIEKAIAAFSVDLKMPDACKNSTGLLSWINRRLRFYQQMIKERSNPKIEMSELPATHFYRDVGYLPLKLIHQLRKFRVIEEEQRILFIFDEYDQCTLANRPEFAKAINSFVKVTARGAIKNVFVNIGSRPHGFHDKSVLDVGGHSKIEDGRDFKGIDLMMLLRGNKKVFSRLVTDIGNRRIQNVGWFKIRGITDIKSLVEKVIPVDEGEKYRSDKSDKEKHFKVLEIFCKPLCNAEDFYSELVLHIKNLAPKALHQKYLIIEACRKLNKINRRNKKDVKLELNELKEKLDEIGSFIKSGGKVQNNSKLYYKLKDLREPALFFLASDYRQPKYYCGFETIKLMSEGVPLNFIKLSRAIFDELRYKTIDFEKRRKIDIRWQNRAIRKVASETRKESGSYLCKGQSFLILLDELGFLFRRMQLNPTAPYPTPNGFSIEKEQEWLTKSGIECTITDESPNYLPEIIREATDWGYLIEMTHRSKEKSLKTRTKYYINAMLSPYYDLSVRHLKEPYYTTFGDLIELCSPDVNVRSEKRSSILSNIKSLQPIGNEQK
jgi:hypothetical protein